LYETHTHTPLCKHAVGEPEEYAQRAWERGLSGLLVTCHNPMPDGFGSRVRMDVDQLDEYIDMMARARESWTGRIDVRLGLEADFVPGYERWLEQQLQAADFEYVLGSIHPQVPEFLERYGHADPLEFQRVYFRLLAESAESGLFDCLAHPDVVKIVAPETWRPARIMDDVQRALDRIARTGTAMEINTSGVHKAFPEMNPFPTMLAEMREREIPIVIGSDAHEPQRVGELFEEALTLAEEAGYDQVSYFVERQRRDVPIAECRRSLFCGRKTRNAEVEG
jgi:histidinol-phosphatase (PHP family)